MRPAYRILTFACSIAAVVCATQQAIIGGFIGLLDLFSSSGVWDAR